MCVVQKVSWILLKFTNYCAPFHPPSLPLSLPFSLSPSLPPSLSLLPLFLPPSLPPSPPSLPLSLGFDVHKERFLYISAACTGIFALIKLAFEFFQLLKLRHRYLLDWINYLEIILFVCSILFIFVFFNDCLCPTFWQWQIGAFAVFLAWIALVIIVRKLPLIGIYVVMFMDIFYTFWKMALLALLLILSFSFSFYMLFNDPTIQLGVSLPVAVSLSIYLSVCLCKS